MAEVITTLHPENDETIDLYPNIKKENIPANAIDGSKIANEAVTENKLDPALQAKLNDEVCILTLSGTSGLLSETNYNKLINAEIAFIVIDGKYYCRSYTTQSGSPAYNIYWFVNITYDDSIVQRQIAVNSSNRFWVLSSQSKLLTFYRDDLDKIIVEAVDTDDLNVTNNIDCLGDIDVEDVNASGLYSLGYHDGEEEIGMSVSNLFEDMETIKFVEGNTYAVNDVVFYNKNLFVCKTAYSASGIIPDPSQDTTYWKRLIVDNKINSNLIPTISYNDLSNKPNVIHYVDGATGSQTFSIPVYQTGTNDRFSLQLQICNQNGSAALYIFVFRGGTAWKHEVYSDGIGISSFTYDTVNSALHITLASSGQWGTWFAIGNGVRV